MSRIIFILSELHVKCRKKHRRILPIYSISDFAARTKKHGRSELVIKMVFVMLLYYHTKGRIIKEKEITNVLGDLNP